MPDTDISFFVDRGTRSRQMIVSFFKDLAGENPSWRVGAMIRLPREGATYQSELAEALDPLADFVLADPETRLMHLPANKRGKGRSDYPYLKVPDPIVNRSRFTREVLAAQLQNQRAILISPWLIHSFSGTPRELNATSTFAEIASGATERGNRKLLLGFEVREDIVAVDADRNPFLNEVVETPAHPIYLRMTVGASPGPAQTRRQDALVGLRKIAEALEANGRALLLPQSGLVGWLMLGFGATGFGSGTQFSNQRPEMPKSGDGGGGGSAPLHWYFWPPFLGFVQAEEAPLLAATGSFRHCGCPYCGNSLPPTGATFGPAAREAAEKHFLWWCAFLADEVRAATVRKQVIRDRLAAATQSWKAAREAGVRLDPRSKPEHLAVWTQVAS